MHVGHGGFTLVCRRRRQGTMSMTVLESQTNVDHLFHTSRNQLASASN